MRDERLPRRFLNELYDMLKGNGEETGLRQRESDAATPSSVKRAVRGRPAPTSVALGHTQCSLDLNLPWFTARLGSQLHAWRFCLGCVGPSANAESAMPTISVAAAAKHATGRAGAFLLLDLATIHENVGHDHLLQEGHALRFDSTSSRRMAFSGGRRGGLSAVPGRRCTGAVAPHGRPNFCWQPNAVEDISGHTAVFPMMVRENGQATALQVQRLGIVDVPVSEGQVTVMPGGSDAFRRMPLEKSAQYGISPVNTVRNLGADLRWRPLRRARGGGKMRATSRAWTRRSEGSCKQQEI